MVRAGRRGGGVGDWSRWGHVAAEVGDGIGEGGAAWCRGGGLVAVGSRGCGEGVGLVMVGSRGCRVCWRGYGGVMAGVIMGWRRGGYGERTGNAGEVVAG